MKCNFIVGKIMQFILSEDERQLVEALVQNSRYTPAILGQLIGKSRNWVSRAVKGLVKSGVIRGYTTIIDPAQVPSARGTILFMKSNPRERNVSESLMQLEELESLDGIAGDFSLIGHFRYDNQGALEDLLDQIDAVAASSRTSKFNVVQVLTTYKKNRFRIIPTESSHAPLSKKELDLLRIIYRQKPTLENPYPLTQDKIGELMNPPLSQPAVSRTIDKLNMRRAIVGYSIDLDYGLIGLPVKFFIRIKVAPGTAGEVAHKLAEHEEVWDLHRTSEDFSLLATVRSSSIDSYNEFLKKMYENEAILDTQSYVSLEEWFMPFY